MRASVGYWHCKARPPKSPHATSRVGLHRQNFATVAAIDLIIDKQQARTVADLLSQSYREQARKLPNLGAGSARYASDSGKTSASISYVHVSFDAQVRMSTRDFDEMLNNTIRKEEQERQHRLEGAF